MERLTKWEDDSITYNEKREFECGEYCDSCSQGAGNCKTVENMIKKLATYEDLEEQGLLVRLPCKVGDDVYIIPSPPIYGLNIFYGCENVNRVYHQHIESITFAGSHWYATGRNEYKEKVLNDTAFGTTWFLTREEAEKKLEEVKNDKA
ncbi:MAG: hypothetical protein BHW52_03235 [Ruminococcus sp. 37_24]|nr:MAG: hypothetical protein BHW52_03235 [Ruminococcus sp. 37_24]